MTLPTGWLEQLVEGATGSPATKPLNPQPGTLPVNALPTITGLTGAQYLVGNQITGTPQYRLYRCLFSDGVEGMLKIAAEPHYNGTLDKEAFILKTLLDQSLEIDRPLGEREKYGNHYGFPNLVETFVSSTQNNRRINVYRLAPMIKSLSELTPLSNIIRQEQMRVDPKTAVWIAGKTLKTLAFAHQFGVANNQVGIGSVLICKEKHAVIIVNWEAATRDIGPSSSLNAKYTGDIAQTALATIDLLGGDLQTGNLPGSDQLTDKRFERFLAEMARGKFEDAVDTHYQFYELAKELWGKRTFHPYTAYPR